MSKTSISPNTPLNALEKEHREFLSGFDARYETKWLALRDEKYEAAMCEAAVRRMLQRYGVPVQPNERLAKKDSGGPDYRCVVNGRHFYVDASCILDNTADAKTGVTDEDTILFSDGEPVFDEKGRLNSKPRN